MTDVRVRISGDSSDAQRAFRELQSTVSNAFDTVQGQARKMASKVERVFSSLRRNVTPLNQGLDLLGRGFNILRESTEQYLRQVENGDQLWTDLERRFREIRGALVEMLVGTDDVEEGYRRLVDMINDTIAVMDGLMTVARPIVNLFRGVFVGALSASADIMAALTGNVEHFSDSLDEMVEDTNEAVTALDRMIERQEQLTETLERQAAVGPESEYREAAEALEDWNRQAARSVILEQGGENAGGSADEVDRLVDALIEGEAAVATFTTETGRALTVGVGEVSDNVQVTLGTLGDVYDTFAEGNDRARDRQRELSIELANAAEALDPMPETVQEVTEETERATGATRDWSWALDGLHASLDVVNRDLDVMIERARASSAAIGNEAAQALTDAQQIAQDSATEFQEFVSGLVAEQTKQVDIGINKLDDLEKATQRQALSADQWASAITSAGDSVHGVLDGIAGASNGSVGEMLDGFSNAAGAMAAMMAFMPGLQGAAAGLGVAAAAGKVIASLLMREGGGGGSRAGGGVSAGVVPVSGTQGPRTVNNTTVVNNMSPLVTRDAARELAPIMDMAVSGGYTRRVGA